MADNSLTWTARIGGWHVADSKATPGRAYHILPCRNGCTIHTREDGHCSVWPEPYLTVVDAKRAAQAHEDAVRIGQTSELQPAAAGSVAP